MSKGSVENAWFYEKVNKLSKLLLFSIDGGGEVARLRVAAFFLIGMLY